MVTGSGLQNLRFKEKKIYIQNVLLSAKYVETFFAACAIMVCENRAGGGGGCRGAAGGNGARHCCTLSHPPDRCAGESRSPTCLLHTVPRTREEEDMCRQRLHTCHKDTWAPSIKSSASTVPHTVIFSEPASNANFPIISQRH